jgi:hypothetical protein
MRATHTAVLLPILAVSLNCSGEFMGAIGDSPVTPGAPTPPGQPGLGSGAGGAGAVSGGAGGTTGGAADATQGPGGPQFDLGVAANLAPRLRLKSNVEIYAGIRDAFGITTANPQTLPSEPLQKTTGFQNDSTAHRVGEGRNSPISPECKSHSSPWPWRATSRESSLFRS